MFLGSLLGLAGGVISAGWSTASRRVLLRRVAGGAGGTSGMGAVSGAELSGTVVGAATLMGAVSGAELSGTGAGAATLMGAVSGAGGTSKAGRLSLLRRSPVGTGAVGTVGETDSLGTVPAGGMSATGFVGVKGSVTDGTASARCRPARKGRDFSKERDMMVASQRLRG